VLFAGNTVNCPAGGTTSYSATTQVQTLTDCRRTYPNDASYSGTYNLTVSTTPSSSVVSATAINNLKVFDPLSLTTLQYSLASGNFNGVNFPGAISDITKLTSGSVVVNAGVASSYTISSLNSSTTNDGNGQTVNINGINGIFVRIAKGSLTYDVNALQAIKIVGNNFPNVGSLRVGYTTTACTPLDISFLPSNQFSMSCGGFTITKNWADADVKTAIASSRQ
jgi:hypothetical protein